jgi:hypothetical protein
MNRATHLEHRASSSRSKHEGESSFAPCDRLDRTRANSQRQIPTDHDYAVPTREYQTDQSSLKPALAAARSELAKRQEPLQRQPHRIRGVDRVTPYQGFILTGRDLDATLDSAPQKWPLSRPPQMLETSLPGVYAVGDIRSNNVKRVASAVGEGSISIHLVHHALAEA